MPQTRHGLSLRWHFAGLGVGLVIPTLAFVGVLLWQFAASERSRVEAEARALSSGVAVAFDREVNGVLTTLQALATSPSLQSRDFPAFYAQVSEIHRLQGIHVSLRDVKGFTILTTRAPLGASVAVPALLAQTDREILRTGAATVSNVFISTTSRRPVFQIVTTPVRVGDEVAFLLAASVDLDYIVEAIKREEMPPGWTAALVDRNGTIALRTERQDDFAGKPASPDFRSQAAAAEAGSYYGRGSDGRELLTGFARSGLSGWTATASVASEVVGAPLRRSLELLLALGLALGLLSAAIAYAIGQRVDRSMRRLGTAARDIGQGRDVQHVATPIAEVNEIGLALATAARQLQERARDRDEAVSALRESNDQLQRYAYVVSHDLRAPLVNVMGFTSELETLRTDIREALAGRPETEALDRDMGEALGFIRAAVTKMEGLIAAILKLSREGRRMLKPEPLEMGPFVQGLADAIRHQTDSAGATIEVAPDLPAITADRLAIEQVFGNLLDNAVKIPRAGAAGPRLGHGRAAGRDRGLPGGG